MSEFNLFRLAGSGMDAQRIVLDVTAENIAGADAWTPRGVYRRRVAELSLDDRFGGLVQARVRESAEPVRWRYDPGNPRAERAGVHRGFVALSPVDTVAEMVALLNAERNYEADAAVLGVVKSGITHALDVERP
ncbi:flagellar basal body rod protein FlgC [bacterium]|nr:MAG: flagellar basal body rod protein FlgC [bacterium]